MAISQARIIESMEQVCSNLNPDEFIFSFLDAYGFPKSTITRLRNGDDSRNVASGNDIGLKKKLYFRSVPEGADLNAEADSLKASEVVSRNDIRFVIVTDFKSLVAFDLKAEERLETTMDELGKQYAFFLPLAGYEKAVMYSEHPADVKASEKMGRLFDLIRERNDLSKPEDIHALNVFLTRLLFCFYAEDTGIFEQGQMTSAIQSTTQEDGLDVDQFFTDLFIVLNLEDSAPERKSMAAHFQEFPYVNGGLFLKDVPAPKFGRKARRILIDCGSLDWSEINPDIFGSMFQAVIDEEQRGNLGQHYTSVLNIMKVIQPLFLDKLYAELERSRKSEKKLKAVLVRLQDLRIFDPACGSGNFLIIAYKEIRKLEMEVIDAINAVSGQAEMYYSGIRLSQFYGIEIDDFAHEVAILALWLAEHQMNTAFKAKFGYSEAALPLRESGNIVCGNSLRVNWETVCPNKGGEGQKLEVYICGNPPFLGFNSRSQEQNEDMEFVLNGFRNTGRLDFVSCWFWKGAQYIQDSRSEFAFVTTNSLCQGAQVEMLWKKVFQFGLKIIFAFQSFPWKNHSKNNAAVHVSVVGLTSDRSAEARLFSLSGTQWVGQKVDNISAYLIAGGNTIVNARPVPFFNMPKMILGNMAKDGGFLFLTPAERADFISDDPRTEKWIRKIIGSQEFLNEKERYCLWLDGITEEELSGLEKIKSRVDSVRENRLKSKAPSTREFAEIPHLFTQRPHPKEGHFIVVPRYTSLRRNYVPIGFFGTDVVSSDKNYIIPNGNLFVAGVLMSTIHLDWMRIVGSRMKSDYGYSAQLVYNTFPWPKVSEQQRDQIETLAEEVLLIREDYPGKSLADLYDPDKMPEPLRDAHKALDDACEQAYREKPFRDASERLAYLFARYEKLVAEENES